MSVDSSRVIDESVFGKKEEIIPLLLLLLHTTRGVRPVVNKCFLPPGLYYLKVSLVTLVMEWRACGHKTKCNATANVSSLFEAHFSQSAYLAQISTRCHFMHRSLQMRVQKLAKIDTDNL